MKERSAIPNSRNLLGMNGFLNVRIKKVTVRGTVEVSSEEQNQK